MRISDQTSLQNQPTTREHILLRLRQPGGYRALYNTQARDSPATHIVREYNHQPHTELSLSRIPSTLPYYLPCLPYLNKVRCHTNPSHTDMKRAMHCLNPE